MKLFLTALLLSSFLHLGSTTLLRSKAGVSFDPYVHASSIVGGDPDDPEGWFSHIYGFDALPGKYGAHKTVMMTWAAGMGTVSGALSILHRRYTNRALRVNERFSERYKNFNPGLGFRIQERKHVAPSFKYIYQGALAYGALQPDVTVLKSKKPYDSVKHELPQLSNTEMGTMDAQAKSQAKKHGGLRAVVSGVFSLMGHGMAGDMAMDAAGMTGEGIEGNWDRMLRAGTAPMPMTPERIAVQYMHGNALPLRRNPTTPTQTEAFSSNGQVVSKMLETASELWCTGLLALKWDEDPNHATDSKNWGLARIGNFFHMFGDTFSASHVERTEDGKHIKHIFSMDVVNWIKHVPADVAVSTKKKRVKSWEQLVESQANLLDLYLSVQPGSITGVSSATEIFTKVWQLLCSEGYWKLSTREGDPAHLETDPAGGASEFYSAYSNRAVRPDSLVEPSVFKALVLNLHDHFYHRHEDFPNNYPPGFSYPMPGTDYCSQTQTLPEQLQCTEGDLQEAGERLKKHAYIDHDYTWITYLRQKYIDRTNRFRNGGSQPDSVPGQSQDEGVASQEHFSGEFDDILEEFKKVRHLRGNGQQPVQP